MTKSGRIAGSILAIIGGAMQVIIGLSWAFMEAMIYSSEPYSSIICLIRGLTTLTCGVLVLSGGILFLTDRNIGGIMVLAGGALSLIGHFIIIGVLKIGYWSISGPAGYIPFPLSLTTSLFVFPIDPVIALIGAILGLAVGSEFSHYDFTRSEIGPGEFNGAGLKCKAAFFLIMGGMIAWAIGISLALYIVWVLLGPSIGPQVFHFEIPAYIIIFGILLIAVSLAELLHYLVLRKFSPDNNRVVVDKTKYRISKFLFPFWASAPLILYGGLSLSFTLILIVLSPGLSITMISLFAGIILSGVLFLVSVFSALVGLIGIICFSLNLYRIGDEKNNTAVKVGAVLQCLLLPIGLIIIAKGLKEL